MKRIKTFLELFALGFVISLGMYTAGLLFELIAALL